MNNLKRTELIIAGVTFAILKSGILERAKNINFNLELPANLKMSLSMELSDKR